MSTPKFTPGPWKAHQGWADSWLDIDAVKYPNWCEVTAPGTSKSPYSRLSINGHFGIANAHLIAAAPDGHALAQFIVEHPHAAKGMGDAPHAEWLEMQRLAQDFLAKAEGRSL